MRVKVVLMLLLFCGLAMAQGKNQEREEMDKKRFERMEAIKIAYITKELSLSPEESKVFWPVYNSHHEKLKSIRESTRPKGKGEMTEAEADELISKFIAGEYEKAKIHEAMSSDLKPIIGSVRVVQLAKVEHKFKREFLKKAGKKQKPREKKGENRKEKRKE